MDHALSRCRSGAGVLLGALLLALAAPAGRAATPVGQFTLHSADWTVGGRVPHASVYDRNGCRGRNMSPALAWRHPPAGTRSFVVLILDSDVAGGWWHWLVFDLPATTRALPAGAGDPGGHGLPAGAVQGRNDYGSVGYGGPCPPIGPAHHYHVLLYALGVSRLPVARHAAPGAIAAAARTAAIAEAEITVVYGR